LTVVGLYWNARGSKGNKTAFALSNALIIDALEERIRKAFGDTSTIEERNQRLADQISLLKEEVKEHKNNSECWKYMHNQAQKDLQYLSEDMTEPDQLQAEIERLMRILRKFDIDPEAPENYM
ncbi:MAG: hypothetical protein F6K50_06380, partial [Moorea sp. SIO3I7]|nr:hypothetical protein [Moorena sp. SIO3I7]